MKRICVFAGSNAGKQPVYGEMARELGLHTKPIGLLNVAGYYDILITLLQQVVSEGFMPGQHASLLLHAEKPDLLLERFTAFAPSSLVQKWDSLPPTI